MRPSNEYKTMKKTFTQLWINFRMRTRVYVVPLSIQKDKIALGIETLVAIYFGQNLLSRSINLLLSCAYTGCESYKSSRLLQTGKETRWTSGIVCGFLTCTWIPSCSAVQNCELRGLASDSYRHTGWHLLVTVPYCEPFSVAPWSQWQMDGPAFLW